MRMYMRIELAICLVLQFVKVSLSSSYLACYSCLYNPALREGTTILSSAAWLPKLRHHNRTMTSSKHHHRQRNYSDVTNTKRCLIHPGQEVTSMPIRICPKIDGYKEFCHREYVMDNDEIVHVSRDCYYSNQRKQIVLSSETLDPVTMVTKRRQQQICSHSLCNQDKHLFAKYVRSTKTSTDAKTQEYKSLEDSIFNRNKRTPTESPDVYHLDNEPSNRRPGNDALPSNSNAPGDVYDEDAEMDEDDDNYYNADGSGVNIDFARWYPTDYPNTAAAQPSPTFVFSFVSVIIMALLLTN